MLALICTSFVVTMLLHKGLTHIHSQKKPRLHFGESFTLTQVSFIQITPNHKVSLMQVYTINTEHSCLPSLEVCDHGWCSVLALLHGHCQQQTGPVAAVAPATEWLQNKVCHTKVASYYLQSTVRYRTGYMP